MLREEARDFHYPPLPPRGERREVRGEKQTPGFLEVRFCLILFLKPDV
jgi:hypothetical protein